MYTYIYMAISIYAVYTRLYVYVYVCMSVYIYIFFIGINPATVYSLGLHPPAESCRALSNYLSTGSEKRILTSVPWYYYLILVTQLTYLKVWSKEIALKHSTVRTWIFAAFTTRIHFFHFTSQKGNPQKIVQMSTFFRRYQRVLTHDRYRIFQLLNNLKPHFVSLNTETVFVNELSIHTFSHTQQSANFLYNFLE